MKQEAIVLLATATLLAASAMAESTNDFRRGPKRGRSRLDRERRVVLEKRKFKLMKRSLDKLGLTREKRQQILELQKEYDSAMKANMEKNKEARAKLSRLLDQDATKEEIEISIQEVSDTQTEQMRILVRNRMEMKQILGEEKYKEFMETARRQFRKHGRRGGPHLPPRPDLPPVPGEESPPDPRGESQPVPVPDDQSI